MGGPYDPRGTQGEPGDLWQGAAAERPQAQGGIQGQGDARMVAQDGPVAAEEHGDGAGMGKGREIAGLLAENILQACSPSASRSYALRSYCNAYVRSALLTGL